MLKFEDDLQRFSEIAREFYYGALADGYHALAARQEIIDKDSDKRNIIDYLICDAASTDQEEIGF